MVEKVRFGNKKVHLMVKKVHFMVEKVRFGNKKVHLMVKKRSRP